MSLYTAFGKKNIPKGVVVVSEEEALKYQKSLIRDWKNNSDVFFLRYGKDFSGLVTLATNTLTWTKITRALKLGSKGHVTTVVFGSLIPSIFVTLTFDELITNKVLLMKKQCPLCFIFPEGLILGAIGVGQAFQTGLFLGISRAIATNSIAVPDVKKQTSNFFRFINTNILKPNWPTFGICTSVQVALAIILPYLQSNELYNVSKMMELKQKLASNTY